MPLNRHGVFETECKRAKRAKKGLRGPKRAKECQKGKKGQKRAKERQFFFLTTECSSLETASVWEATKSFSNQSGHL